MSAQIGPPGDGGRAGGSGGVRWILVGAVVVLAAAAAVLILLLVWPDAEEPVVPLPDPTSAWAEIAAEVPLGPERSYSDDELGLYDIIDETVFYRPYYARGRTFDDFLARVRERRDRIFYEASGHERERLSFVDDVEGAIVTAYSLLPEDVGPGGMLEQANDEWMADCVADAGYPDVVLDPDTREEVPVYAAEEEQLEAYQSTTGFTRDEFYDLRFECAQQAARYPTLDPEVRDELIDRLRRRLLEAVHEYIRDYDIVEIPVEHHEGMVHPVEESYIVYCLEWEISERDACAEQHRVELTEEHKTASVPEREPEDESVPYPLVGQPCGSHLPDYEDHPDLPGMVITDRDGHYCDKFENLEFLINNPETEDSQARAANLFKGGPRLLLCPSDWVTDDEGKCRYPRPEEADMRDAFVEAHPDHPEFADANNIPLLSSYYPDKD